MPLAGGSTAETVDIVDALDVQARTPARVAESIGDEPATGGTAAGRSVAGTVYTVPS